MAKTGKKKSKDNQVSAKQIKLQKLAVDSPFYFEILTNHRQRRRSKKK